MGYETSRRRGERVGGSAANSAEARGLTGDPRLGARSCLRGPHRARCVHVHARSRPARGSEERRPQASEALVEILTDQSQRQPDGLRAINDAIYIRQGDSSVCQQVALTLARSSGPLLAQEVHDRIAKRFEVHRVPLVSEVRTGVCGRDRVRSRGPVSLAAWPGGQPVARAVLQYGRMRTCLAP